MNRLGWYWSRVRAMSAPELAWRVGRIVSETAAPVLQHAQRTRDVDSSYWEGTFAGFRDAVGRPVLLDRARAADLARRFPAEAAAVVAAADECRAGRFAFFGQAPVDLGPGPIDWQLDPRSGFRWPAVPANRLDHRTAAADPKWIWELNRLQHLPWLAQAWLFTGDRAYADAAVDQLDGWLEQNPVGHGIAWRGAFEVGVRALSVTVALQGLRDAPSLTRERYARAVSMLSRCAPLLWRQRSRFSSANNHLVGEMAGLAAIAILHPEIPGARRWEARALGVLAREAGRQILPDGAGAEQSTVYQQFCSDLFLVPTVLVRLRGDQPPQPVLDGLQRGARYLRALLGDGDPLPRYGDDDGGIALRLLPDQVPDVHRHLAAVSALLGEAAADLAAAWLGGSGGAAVPARAERELYAADGGLVVMRREDRRITVDTGPLGYLSIAAHGHADALSVTVTAGGRDLVGDPGTGSYYAEPAWRRAFRGTRAHATVAVDDEDQSVPGGPFLWVRHANTTVRSVDLERGIVEAEHDGYTRFAQPVTHRRYVVAPRGQSSVLVVDLLTGEGEHRVRTAWPLHPELDARMAGDTHLVTRDGRSVLQIATAAGTPWAVRGDEETRLGWWSPRFEAWEPAWLVGTVLEAARLPVVVATVLTVSQLAEPVVEGLTVGGTDVIEVGWTEREGDARVARSVALDPAVPGAVTVGTPHDTATRAH
jgi:uncharacterized heparinase superfamily protein